MEVLRVFLFLGMVLLGEAVRDHISESGRSVRLGAVQDDPPCDSVFSCLSCSESRVCRPTGPGQWVTVRNVPCTDPTPFCNYDTGTCSSTIDSKCGEKNDTFICPTENGHFPDPTDPGAYHVCSNYAATKFACASGLEYDPDAADCKLLSKLGARQKVDCSGPSEGQKRPFPGYEGFFGYCSANNVVIVDRCQGDYRLNTTSQACEPICVQDGVLRDWEDCTSFYLCSTLYLTRNLTFTIREHMSCPAGQGYNPKLYMCTDIKYIPGCYPPTTTTAGPTASTQRTRTTAGPTTPNTTPRPSV